MSLSNEADKALFDRIEGYYNGFGYEETTATAIENASFYVSNYIMKDGKFVVFYSILDSDKIWEAPTSYFIFDVFSFSSFFMKAFFIQLW